LRRSSHSVASSRGRPAIRSRLRQAAFALVSTASRSQPEESAAVIDSMRRRSRRCRLTRTPRGYRRPAAQRGVCSASAHFAPASMMTTTPPKNTAFMKALQPSAALAVVEGSGPLPRTEVTKRIWDYIKAHNLQNPANKRNILCDARAASGDGQGRGDDVRDDRPGGQTPRASLSLPALS
jgi:hypothetical protein